jgi:hypothetical protein
MTSSGVRSLKQSRGSGLPLAMSCTSDATYAFDDSLFDCEFLRDPSNLCFETFEHADYLCELPRYVQ